MQDKAWPWVLGFAAFIALCIFLGQSHESSLNGPPDCYVSAEDAATGGC